MSDSETDASHVGPPESPYTSEERELACRLLFLFGLMARGPMERIQGVSRGEMAMLGLLDAAGSSQAPTELAERLSLTTARVANTLNALECKGYVLRALDPLDRRRVEVSITPAGSAYFRARQQEAINDVCGLVHDLDTEDVREFIRITARIEERFFEREGIPLPPFPPICT